MSKSFNLINGLFDFLCISARDIIFSTDVSNSMFADILGGDIEAFIDNKVINELSLEDDVYTLVLNGEILIVSRASSLLKPRFRMTRLDISWMLKKQLSPIGSAVISI